MERYVEYVLNHLPKVLTQMDRDKHSKTYGSFDRAYWHLKLHDFSSAILQQSSLTLALAYSVEFEGNIYYDNPWIREWAIAGLRYLGKIQLKDGSFNEYYPNEHGFPPTAFILFSGCYTCLLLGIDDKEIIDILYKTAIWLAKHDETNAYNQEVAALTGLALYQKLAHDVDIQAAIDHKLEILQNAYCAEGWLPEQGGADIGYLSVSLDMLMEYYRLSRDSRVCNMLSGIIDFLSYFVHPDGTTGGEYGARNTIYYMPAGFENAIECGLNKELAEQIVFKVFSENSGFMYAVDERYNTHYVMHSYLRALRYSKNRNIDSNKSEMVRGLPCEQSCKRFFSKAGLFVYSEEGIYWVLSLIKGGVVKIYKDDRVVLCDCGYRIPIQPGKTAATNWLSSDYNYKVDDSSYSVEGHFHMVSQKVQNTMYMTGIRFLSKLMGKGLNSLLKRLTIYQKNSIDVSFRREIRIEESSLIIDDLIDNPMRYNITEAPNISLRLVASGNFFSRADIVGDEKDSYGNPYMFHRIRIVDIGSGEVKTEIENGTR